MGWGRAERGDEWAELVIGNAWDTPLVDAKWEPGAGRQVLSRHGFPRYAQFAIPRLLDLIAQGLKQWINFDWSGRINCDAEVTNQQYKKTKLPQIAAFIL